MIFNNITHIEIDEQGRLHLKPEFEKFSLIYRTATEVHWDDKKLTLYSPKPKDWDYLEWYQHILKVTESECSVKLKLNNSTKWINIPDDLKSKMIEK